MKKYFACLLASSIFMSSAFAGNSITGQMLDEYNAPVESIVVTAQGPTGNEYQTLTDSNGEYEFTLLPAGSYVVSADAPLNHKVTAPDCSFDVVTVSSTNDEVVDFDVHQDTGDIACDFGTPGGPTKLLSSTATAFTVTVILSNLPTSGNMAKTVSVTGYWFVPGVGQLETQATGGEAKGFYGETSLQAQYTNHLDGSVTLTMDLASSPYISEDGVVALYSFALDETTDTQLAQGLNRLSFCIESMDVDGISSSLSGDVDNWLGKVL